MAANGQSSPSGRERAFPSRKITIVGNSRGISLPKELEDDDCPFPYELGTEVLPVLVDDGDETYLKIELEERTEKTPDSASFRGTEVILDGDD